MNLTELLAEVITQLGTVAPTALFLEQGEQQNAHFTIYPVSTVPTYSVSCVGSIGDAELVQVDGWAKTLTEALELDRQALAILEPLGYTLGAATQTLRDPPWWRRTLTIRKTI